MNKAIINITISAWQKKPHEDGYEIVKFNYELDALNEEEVLLKETDKAVKVLGVYPVSKYVEIEYNGKTFKLHPGYLTYIGGDIKYVRTDLEGGGIAAKVTFSHVEPLAKTDEYQLEFDAVSKYGGPYSPEDEEAVSTFDIIEGKEFKIPGSPINAEIIDFKDDIVYLLLDRFETEKDYYIIAPGETAEFTYSQSSGVNQDFSSTDVRIKIRLIKK